MKEENLESNVFLMKPNTQLTYANLKLGIGQIRPAHTFNGDQADIGQYYLYIWPFLKGKEKGCPAVLFYEGKTVVIDDYTIIALEINKDAVKLSINN